MYQVPFRFVSMTARQPLTLKSIAGLRKLAAAVVDHEVEPAEALPGLGYERVDLFRVADGHRARGDVAIEVPPDAVSRFLELLLAPAADHDVGAEPRQCVRHSATHPGAAARHEAGLAREQIRAKRDWMSRELLVGESPVTGRAGGLEPAHSSVHRQFLCSPNTDTLATLRFGMPPRLCVSPNAGEPICRSPARPSSCV